VRLLFERYYAAGLGRFRLAVTSAAQPAKAIDFPTELEPLLLLAQDKLTEEQRQQLLKQFMRMAPELSNARAPMEQLRRTIPAHPTTLVMAERPPENPRPTFIHHRGEFLQPGERVDPAVPAVLHALPTGVLRNRLTFAKWLVSPDNPLV